MDFLKNVILIAALKEAWQDSNPGPFGAHEEGGFLLRDSVGDLSLVRWPPGKKNVVFCPPHPGCRYNDKDIIATFHTHPNTGKWFDPEPNDDDCWIVHHDSDLKGTYYIGEFIVSKEWIYLVHPNGTFEAIERTERVFELGDEDANR